VTGPIVCAFEDTDPAIRAAAVAGWLAAEIGASMLLVHAFDEGALPALDLRSVGALAFRDRLAALQEQLARRRMADTLAVVADALAPVNVSRELIDGKPVPVLTALAADRGAMLVVSGTAARGGMDRLMQGSVAARLAASTPCPTVTVPPDAMPEEPGPVLAAYDGSSDSRRAARHAAVLAARLGRELLIVGVSTRGDRGRIDPDVPGDMHAAVSGAPAIPPGGLHVSLEERDGEPAAAVARAAGECRACLVVTPTRGRGDLRTALFGSITLEIVRSAARPVVLVPASAGDLR
jgi:nucleotide-binding universal stress UspA family protein